jgi:hypothetical protein
MNTLIELNITGKTIQAATGYQPSDVKQLINNYGATAINKDWTLQPYEAIVCEVVKK